jgi:hypothetical protein
MSVPSLGGGTSVVALLMDGMEQTIPQHLHPGAAGGSGGYS